jgi:hypothetical protein
MLVITKSGHKINLELDGTVLTRETERGNLLVDIRDTDGKTVGLFLDPQAIVP